MTIWCMRRTHQMLMEKQQKNQENNEDKKEERIRMRNECNKNGRRYLKEGGKKNYKNKMKGKSVER